MRHLTPLLLAQARYRFARQEFRPCEPEDLVQQVWLICLPKLARIEPRAGRFTPPLVKFLSNTLLRHFNDLVERHLRTGGRAVPVGAATSAVDVPDDATGVLSRAVRDETVVRVLDRLQRLSEPDREIIVLRAIEQLPYQLLGLHLEASADALKMRFHRAMERLRGILPPSLVDELVVD